MENKVDLHIHTTFSDGQLDPCECIDLAIKEGVKVMAITDHCTFEGVEEAIFYAKNKDIKIIAGIELFTNHPCNFHVLCYFKNLRFLELQPYIFEKNHENQLETVKTAIKMLKSIGFKCKYSQVLKESKKLNRGIYGVFLSLCNQGYFKTPYDVQKALFNKGCSCYFKNNFTLTELIENVREVGGSVFIAHPISYNLTLDMFKKVMPELIESGIDGLEKYHATSDDEKIKAIGALCKKYDLLFSGGSDFHGSNRPNAELGYYFGHRPLTVDLFWNIFAR
ncbi:MAG: PHP domain-containing protein [Clostridia bacterium]